MLKQCFILSLISLLALAGCSTDDGTKKPGPNKAGPDRGLDAASFPNVDNTVYGAWQMDSQTNNGIVFTIRLYINRQNQFGLSQECEFANGKVFVTNTLEATIAANQIQILENFDKSVKSADGKETCTLSAKSGTLLYQVTGDVLVLTDASTGEPAAATRIR